MKKLLAIVLLTIALAGCKAPQIVETKTVRDTVRVEKLTPVIVKVPSDSTATTLNMADLNAMVQRNLTSFKPGEKTKVIYKTDNSQRAQLTLMVDSLGNLIAKSNCKEEEVKKMLKEAYTTIRVQNEVIREANRSLWDKIQQGIGSLALWIIGIAVVIAGIYVAAKRLF